MSMFTYQWAAVDLKHVSFATRSINHKKGQALQKCTQQQGMKLKQILDCGEQDWFQLLFMCAKI